MNVCNNASGLHMFESFATKIKKKPVKNLVFNFSLKQKVFIRIAGRFLGLYILLFNKKKLTLEQEIANL